MRIAERGEKVAPRRARGGRLDPTAYTRARGAGRSASSATASSSCRSRWTTAAARLLEQWTGDQVAWTMARGYEGAFGRKLNAPYVWLPLCLLFLAPFVDLRRPFRLLHLDLLVLLALRRLARVLQPRRDRDVGAARVPGAGSTCWCGCWWPACARASAPGPLVPHVPLAVAARGGLVFLLSFRIGLNVVDSNVIDVGYAGVIGADRIVDGDQLYGEGFSRRRRARRHLRAGQLPALRAVRAGAAVERPLGRPARGARRGDRLRPAGDRPACCCSGARLRAGPRGHGARAWRWPTPGRPIPTRRSRSRRTRTTRWWRWRASARCWRSRCALARGRGAGSRSGLAPRPSSRRSRWRRCSRGARRAALGARRCSR